jgi:hypothetical protein
MAMKVDEMNKRKIFFDSNEPDKILSSSAQIVNGALSRVFSSD